MAKSSIVHPKISMTGLFVIVGIVITVVVWGLIKNNAAQNLQSRASRDTTLSTRSDLLTLETELKILESDGFFRELEQVEADLP